MRRRRRMVVNRERERCALLALVAALPFIRFPDLALSDGKYVWPEPRSHKPREARREHDEQKWKVQEVDGNEGGGGNQKMDSAFQGAPSDLQDSFDDDGDDDGLKTREESDHHRHVPVSR